MICVSGMQLDGVCFLHNADVCPTALHKKHVILSSVKNIIN